LFVNNADASSYYVRTDGHDSNCNGTADVADADTATANCAWLTVQKAINPTGGIPTTSGVGNTLYTKNGTYTGTNWNLTPRGNGDILTIEGYNVSPGDGASVDLSSNKPVIRTTSATDAVYIGFATAPTSGTTTLRNINFTPTNLSGSNAVIKWGNTAGANSPNLDLNLDFVTVVATSTVGTISGTSPTTPIRNLSVTNSNFSALTARAGIATTGWKNVTVSSSTITSVQTSAGGSLLTILGSLTDLTIINNIFTGYDIVTTASATSGHYANISNNTFYSTVSAITIPSYFSQVVIDNNQIYPNWTNYGGYVIQLGLACSTPHVDWCANQISNVFVRGNLISKTGTTNSSEHLLYIAPAVTNAELHNNKFINVAGGGYGVVIKGDNVNFNHNIVVSGLPLYIVGSRNSYFTNNSVYSNTVNSSAVALGITASGYQAPYNNIVINNIVHGGLGQYALINDGGNTTTGIVDSSMTRVNFSEANWTNASLTITANNQFSGYTNVLGNYVVITGGTGVILGQYIISSATANTLVLVASNDINGANGDISDSSISGYIDVEKGQNNFNNNNYVIGTSAIGKLRSSVGDPGVSPDLSTLRSRWAIISPNFSSNDSNSTSSDPLFINLGSNNLNIQPLSPDIDSGTSSTLTSTTTDYLGNPIYGTPDIGAYEYQPPFTIGTSLVDPTGNIRIYGDGKYRYTTATSSTMSANLSATPAETWTYQASTTRPEWLNISSITWGSTKQWTASSTTATTTIYTVGDLTPNSTYTITLDNLVTNTITGSSCSDNICIANSEGKIIFTYTGGYSAHTFTVSPYTAPAPTPIPQSVSSGSSARSRISNLISLGLYSQAEQIAKQYNLPLPSNIPTKTPTSSLQTTFTRNLKQGMIGNDVKTLQQFLNSKGFIVSKTGSGSPNKETSYFGPATKAALMKFQLFYKKEILDPQGLAVPTGYFGEGTRRVINNSVK